MSEELFYSGYSLTDSMSKVVLAIVILVFAVLVLVEVYSIWAFFIGLIPRTPQNCGLLIIGFFVSLGVGILAEQLWREDGGS